MLPIVSISSPSVVEGGNLEFVVSLDRPTPSNITFTAVTRGQSAGADVDYDVFNEQTITIPAGQMSVSVIVDTYADSTGEGDEVVEFRLNDLSDNAQFANGASEIRGTGIIEDNDGTAVARTVTVESSFATEGNDPNVMIFEVRLSDAFTTAKTVNYATSDGTATSANDYFSTTGTITFQPGQTVAFVNVTLRNDSVRESSEDFELTVSGFASGDLFGNATGDTGTGTIFDEDLFAESIFGTTASETLTGTGNAESLFGGVGSDTINASFGDDVLFGGSGNDRLDGQSGDDEVSYADVASNMSINLLSGMAVGSGTDTLLNIVNASGGLGDDNVFGDNDANILKGNEGDDVLAGRDGNDELFGGLGDDGLAGGNDADTLDGGSGDDRLFGGNGSDLIFGGRGEDIVNGGAGNDSIEGGAGDDIALVGGSGNDLISGGFGDDAISGSDGADVLFGGGAFGDGEFLLADTGNDRLFGGGDGDIIIAGDGDDLLNGGGGNDPLLLGGTGDDGISGGSGNDNMLGENGDDRLFGGAGADTITGGAGNDLISGGTGVDTFVFDNGFGRDVIARYGEVTAGGPRVDEVIDLSSMGIEFDDVLIQQVGNSTFIQVPGAQNFGASIELTFTNASTITEDDFLF